jgi:phosphonate transport system substrate-binding protein
MLPDRRRLVLLLAGAGAGALCPALSLADTGAERPTLHLGVVSERANQPDYVLMQYAPLLEHVRRELALKGFALGELRIAKDIAELAGFVRGGRVDIVLESMLSGFRMNASGALLHPFLAASRKGRRETRTLFFVRQSSPIMHLPDLAGKILALESPRSTTAYALPKIVLRAIGLDVQPFERSENAPKRVRYILATAESNQAYWVDRGQADAAAFNTEDWEELPSGLRQKLRIIHTTEPILRWLLWSRIGLPLAALEAIESVFLNLQASPEGLQALQQAGRILNFDRLSRDDLASIQRWQSIAARSRFGE